MHRAENPRRPWRRSAASAVTAVIAVVLSVVGFGAAAEAGGGARHPVIVDNHADASHQARGGVQAVVVASPNATPENLALARASCTDCRTVAVAMQLVILTGGEREASPRNAAVAVNQDCLRCQTAAFAYQHVIAADRGVYLSADGQREVQEIRQRADAIARSGMAFPEMHAALDALSEELRQVGERELYRAGAPVTARASDAAGEQAA